VYVPFPISDLNVQRTYLVLFQVLTCVLTTAEGAALDKMGSGLVRRYREAHVDPPKVLYVDRDCCGPAAGQILSGWNDLQVQT